MLCLDWTEPLSVDRDADDLEGRIGVGVGPFPVMEIGTEEIETVACSPPRRLGDHMNEVLYDPASYILLYRSRAGQGKVSRQTWALKVNVHTQTRQRRNCAEKKTRNRHREVKCPGRMQTRRHSPNTGNPHERFVIA